MAGEIYDLNSDGVIDAEEILMQTNNIKDLLNIEFSPDEDNILLNKKILKLLYFKLAEAEKRIKMLEKKLGV